MKYEQWLCQEITIQDSKASHAVDCEIYVIFKSPKGKEYKRQAFWNGDNNFTVRFFLNEIGKWNYIFYNVSESLSGQMECISYRGYLPIYKNGLLKVGPKGKYLSYADNTPFFWLGDTHWHFALYEKFNESNDHRFTSQFCAIVDKRVEQGFNVYQCNFHCEAEPQLGTEDKYFTKKGETWIPNLEFLQNDLDKKMAYLAEKGFSIAAGFSWFFSAFAENGKKYYDMAARYIIARYGAYPMIWTLAGEVGAYAADMRVHSINFWREIALVIEQNDCYGHLQTAHYTNERPFADYYQEETWFDFTLNQAGHGDYPIDIRPYRKHRREYSGKPFIESESMYENVLTLEANGRRNATPAMLRRVAYIAIQAGSCGFTYGAQGIWHLQWDKPDPNSPSLGFGLFNPWYEAIDFVGADQMRIMKNFYESVEWYRLKPLPNEFIVQGTGSGYLITANKKEEDLQSLFSPAVTADDDMRIIVAYYGENKTFQIQTGFRTLTKNSYTAYWFQPETGEKIIIDENVHPENGVWVAPLKPMAEDALLVLRANEN